MPPIPRRGPTGGTSRRPVGLALGRHLDRSVCLFATSGWAHFGLGELYVGVAVFNPAWIRSSAVHRTKATSTLIYHVPLRTLFYSAAPMINPRSIRLVAGFDLYESLRSKKAIALLLIYTVVALGGSALFIEALNTMMEGLAERLGKEVTAELLASDELVDIIAKLVGNDKTIARELLSVPPLALFYGWLATNFMPLVVVLTSSDAISGEVASGSVRYALFRSSRLDWAIGKLLGQSLLMTVGIAIGAIAAYLLGAAMLDTFEAGSTFMWIIIMAGRSIFYGFAYLGVAMCASMLVKSNAAARAIGIFMVFALSIAGSILQAGPVEDLAPPIIKAVRQVFPNAHSLTLFHPDFVSRLPSMVALLFIGAAYFGLGFLRFSKRDT